MSSKKERRKAQRRAEKEMEDAWEAVQSERLTLAEKCSRRAVDLGAPNPRLWNDHGKIMVLCEQLDDAEQAFRMAIMLAPNYAEAFANLASLQVRHGKIEAAERLQRRAVECDDTPEARAVWQGYVSLLPERTEDVAVAEERPEFTERTERYEWQEVETELRRRGCVRLPALLAPNECRQLATLFDDEELFEHEVVRDDDRARVAYRFFQPLPPLVAALRAEVYARAAFLGNRWNEALRRGERYPATLVLWLAQCRRAGQYRTAPILLRYPVGGFNGVHRDVSGRLAFPFNLEVNLGPLGTAEGGGSFRLVDERRGKKQRGTVLETDVGDGVLFCVRERLVDVAGVPGLQPVLHAVTEVRERPRFALGIPFHDFG